MIFVHQGVENVDTARRGTTTSQLDVQCVPPMTDLKETTAFSSLVAKDSCCLLINEVNVTLLFIDGECR
jgi:hypothetical protein